MLSFDPAGTKVILIGTTTCPKDQTNLPDLPSVGNNIAELTTIFRDPEIVGLAEENIEVFVDPPSSTQLLVNLWQLARNVTDTLLVYYAGHGIKSADADSLFIATAETTQD